MAKPAQSWRMKGIDIAAWQNDRGYSYTFRKTYKDKASGEYKESKYWYPDDLTVLSELLSQVDKWRDARNLDRQIHEAEGVASGQGKPGPAAKHEEYDDIPF